MPADENPSGVVYGIIVVGALLAAESARTETYVDTVVSTAIATALYWLAHTYSNVIGSRLELQQRLTARMLLGALARDFAIVRGAAVPLVALIVAWLAGAPLGAGVTAALWCCIAGLVAFEVLAGVRARASARELMLEAAVGATMGLAVLLLKVVMH